MSCPPDETVLSAEVNSDKLQLISKYVRPTQLFFPDPGSPPLSPSVILV